LENQVNELSVRSITSNEFDQKKNGQEEKWNMDENMEKWMKKKDGSNGKEDG
jgi:hypothetical protein